MPINISDLETWHLLVLLIVFPALGILLGRILVDLYIRILQAAWKTKILFGVLGYIVLRLAVGYFFGEQGTIAVGAIVVVLTILYLASIWRDL